DLISKSRVVNLSDIKRKQLTTDKNINNISFIGEEAWLACGFGIVVINLKKQEIKDTYLIGENGSTLGVNDIETDGEYIYAATNKGILKAQKDGANLLDFKSWVQIQNIPHYSDKFNLVEIHAGKLIANYTPDQWDGDQLYVLNENSWETYLPQIRFAYEMQSTGKFMTITSREQIFVIDDTHQIVKEVNNYKLNSGNIRPINPR